MLGCASSLLLGWVNLGHGIVVSFRGAAEYDVYCCVIVALQEEVQLQLYADNLKCVSRDPGVLLRAAWFTTGYVRLVGQEPAHSKCVLMSTTRTVRSDMRGWMVTDEVHGWLPFLPEVHLPRLTGEVLADVVQRKGATAGGLDGWGWRELKVLPVSWFDGLARILAEVEDLGVLLDGLLDAQIAMIPKTDGDSTPLGQRPLSVLPIVYRIWASARMVQLEGWFRSWVPDSVFSAGGGRGSVEAWYTSAFAIEEVLTGASDSDVHLFVADVIKSFDTVDRRILDRVLSSLGLPGWFRHAYFEYHAHVRLRFKLLLALVSLGLVMVGSLRAVL